MHQVAVAAVASGDPSQYVEALQQIIHQTAPVITAIDHEERLRAPIPTAHADPSYQAGSSRPSRLRPIGRRAHGHRTVFGPEPREDLPLPHMPEPDVPSSSTPAAATSTSIHETHLPSSAPSAEQQTSEIHIPASEPSVELQSHPPATEACASLSSDMDDFWSGILHIEPFPTSPASRSLAAAVDTGMSVSAPQAPIKAYTRRHSARRTGTSASTPIPLVLPTASAAELGVHEPLVDEAREDDAPASVGPEEAHVDDAPTGQAGVEATPLPLANIVDDVPMHPDRPRRARKRTRCGTE